MIRADAQGKNCDPVVLLFDNPRLCRNKPLQKPVLGPRRIKPPKGFQAWLHGTHAQLGQIHGFCLQCLPETEAPRQKPKTPVFPQNCIAAPTVMLSPTASTDKEIWGSIGVMPAASGSKVNRTALRPGWVALGPSGTAR